MGIAVAFGAVVGAQAIRQPLLLAVLLASLCAVTLATVSTQRSILCVLVAGTMVGALAGFIRAPVPATPLYENPGMIEALVVSDPDVEQWGSSAWVEWQDPSGIDRRSYARLPSSPAIGRGDVLEASTISAGVHGEVLRVTRHRVVRPPEGAERIRRTIRARLTEVASDRITGSPGTLTLGLMIGDDSALPATERLELRQSGLSHITAVSGWNVTLVTGSIGAVFLAFRLRGWFWVLTQLTLMGTYVWVVGLDPPVTRAAIMAVVTLAAARFGRPAHSITALSLAAAIMVMLTPGILGSLSFQLSVLATFALIAALRLSERFSGWRRAVVTPPLACSMTGLATAPVLAATFGTLSLATVPANILAGPIVPIASIGGLLTMLLEPVSPLASFVGASVWLLCSAILYISRVCAGAPYAYFEFTPLAGSASAVVHLIVIASVAAATPEGRLMRRRLSGWTRAEPRAAIAAGAGMAAMLVTSIVVI
ncbi:MAG TPA: ComEC/Rec2 family competence protein [Thermomicrobiales bacterium]|nr:ComEC/Rec2 family competence protein [Thermomicrobiales bacterium]